MSTLSTLLLVISGFALTPTPALADPQLSYTIDCALPVDQQEGTWVGSGGNFGRNVNLGGAATYTVSVTMKNCEYHMWGTYGAYQYNNYPGGSDRTGIADIRTYSYTITSNYFSNARFSGYNIWGAMPQLTTFQMNISNYLAAPSTPSTPSLDVGDGKVTVTPVDSGTGGTPTYFTVTASPGGATCRVTLPATSCEITGLTNGTAYTFITTATNGGGTSAGSTATTAVKPHINPTIGSISPTSGSILGGTTLTINGTGFAAGATVNVGGTACTNVIVVSATQITCVAPAGTAGSANVVVNNLDTGTATSAGAFTYNPISTPTIGQTSPTGGSSSGGTTITISGTGFVSGATVTVGGAPCTSVTFVSSTSITCVTPAGTASSSADIAVTNPDTGTTTQSGGFNYFSAPQIGVISPSSGPVAGGTAVTITGTGFVDGATISIGGVACASVTFVSSTSITCVTAAGTAGAMDVVVTNPDSGSGTSTGGFTFNAPASGGGGLGSNGGIYKPSLPRSSDFNLTHDSSSITVAANYSGGYLETPDGYLITVAPGGKSCIIPTPFSNCTISGLNPNVEYAVSITAINSIGRTTLNWPYKFILSSTGVQQYEAQVAITNFGGDSAKLTAKFKAQIKVFVTKHSNLKSFTCTGYIAGASKSKASKGLAKARAKAVCNYIKSIVTDATTTVIAITPSAKFNVKNRKVIIRAFSAAI